jgi:hypothetical protein
LYNELDDMIDADTLIELGLVKQVRTQPAAHRLTDEGIDALADIIANRHSVPTIGFWRRYSSQGAA